MKSLVATFLLAGCVSQRLKVEPVKVEPIHMTIDINLREGKGPPDRAPK